MKADYNPYLFWIPRILTILLILFVMLFSLDVFNGKHTFWEYVGGFLIHNIPAGILLITLIISWRYEIVGAIVYIAAGLFYSIMMFFNSNFSFWNAMSAVLLLGLPAVIIGILFLIGWSQRRKIAKEN
jgi:hypothetical protein